MIPLPKPRGFWDYTLFALLLTGFLVGLFWLEASGRVGWGDAALAFAAAVLCALAIILARRREKAAWIMQPTWKAKLLIILGAFSLTFGAICTDAYFLHRGDLTPARLRHFAVLGIMLLVAVFSSLRRPNHTTRQSP